MFRMFSFIYRSYSRHEALEEIVSEKWGLNLLNMAGITTDNASNNKKAFENYTWIPCFGHNLHLAVGKALGLPQVSSVLSRLRVSVRNDEEPERQTEGLKATYAKTHS